MRLIGSVCATWILLGASSAFAQATVDVRVVDSAGRPSEGRVRLVGASSEHECRTTAGHCTILGVTPGQYEATLAPVRESPPPPRTIEVPANGTIVLAMASRPSGTPQQPIVAAATITPVVTTAAPVARPTNGVTIARRTTVAARPVTTRAPVVSARRGTVQGGTTGPVVVPEAGPTVVAAMQPTQAVANVDPPRDLTAGIVVKVQGAVTDGAGRPCDARLVVRRANEIVGVAASTAGSFSLYDLGTGEYTVEATSVRNGAVVRMPVSVGGGTSRMVVRLP